MTQNATEEETRAALREKNLNREAENLERVGKTVTVVREPGKRPRQVITTDEQERSRAMRRKKQSSQARSRLPSEESISPVEVIEINSADNNWPDGELESWDWPTFSKSEHGTRKLVTTGQGRELHIYSTKSNETLQGIRRANKSASMVSLEDFVDLQRLCNDTFSKMVGKGVKDPTKAVANRKLMANTLVVIPVTWPGGYKCTRTKSSFFCSASQ